jgi:hypothetical protein
MAKKSKNDSQSVDAYLATLPKAEREALERLRTLIKKTIPRVEERISYGTTVMSSLGADLVGFVSQPKHLFLGMDRRQPLEALEVHRPAREQEGARCHPRMTIVQLGSALPMRDNHS